MRYQNSIIINLPVEKVIELFDNPDNLKHWQKGLQSFEHLSGISGQPGAKSKLIFQMGKRRVEMIETVTERNLPLVFAGYYEATGVWNAVSNSFIDNGNGTTTWKTDTEFKFTNFMMKTIGFLMPGAFKKQSQVFLQDFKTWAESV